MILFRRSLFALTLLVLITVSCTHTPQPRMSQRPEPGPDCELPHLLWQAEFFSEDVRLAKKAKERVLMVYWEGNGEGELVFLDLGGEVLGRKRMSGLPLAAGFRIRSGMIEVLYQDLGGIVSMFGITPGGETVPVEFEEPYSWDALALMARGPLEVIFTDDRWIYHMGLQQGPRGWLLQGTITGPMRAR